jgi:hypothetical protein
VNGAPASATDQTAIRTDDAMAPFSPRSPNGVQLPPTETKILAVAKPAHRSSSTERPPADTCRSYEQAATLSPYTVAAQPSARRLGVDHQADTRKQRHHEPTDEAARAVPLQ